MPEFAPLAEVVRSGFVEGIHVGHAVIVDPDGTVVASWGDPQAVILPRSANKPAQASAMIRAGLDLPPRLRALSTSSHSGESMHLAGALEILSAAGVPVEALRTPPDFPLDPVERDAWIVQGRTPEPIAMNCSGKHAAMLATAAGNGWPLDDYRRVDHPLQQAIIAEVSALSGEPVSVVGVDGCGAPVLGLTVAGLARSLSACVQAESGSPSAQVVEAMRAWPMMVGGTRRDVSRLMEGLPGLVVKDGAEGVFVAALPDGRAIAIKALDGSERARLVVLVDLLERLGVVGEVLDDNRTLTLLGGGQPVGCVRSALE
ncbi:MAG: asparaginase [Actinomycetales bacterium]|nr:asparaginase [Actinomycetales bacterium]